MNLSIRHATLHALDAYGILELDEIQEKVGEKNRKRLLDNLNAAIADKLIDRRKDDATHLPVYQITSLGKDRLKSGIGSKGGENAAKRAAKPAPVDSIPGDVGVVGKDADLGETVQEVVAADEQARMAQGMLEDIAKIAGAYVSNPLASALDGVKAMEAALYDAYVRLNRWSEVATGFGISGPDHLADALDGCATPQRLDPEVAKAGRGYMCLAALNEVDMVFGTEEEARKVAQEVALSEHADFHVVSLLGTAKFELVPSVKWGA